MAVFDFSQNENSGKDKTQNDFIFNIAKDTKEAKIRHD
jgi:hypothetical protein